MDSMVSAVKSSPKPITSSGEIPARRTASVTVKRRQSR